jgi:hypothetical protein
MTLTRRGFLLDGSAAVWIAALQSVPAIKQRGSQPFAHPDDETDSVAFWNQFFNPPKPADEANRGATPKAQPATAGSQVEYVHLGPDGLRYVQDIKPDELANISGDVMLSVSPAQFRFGGETNAENFLHSAQLRFDIHQSHKFLDVLPVLAWTSLAAIFPEKSGKLPPIQGLNFTSSTEESAVDKILLPAGMGTIAVNLSTAKKASTLYNILQAIAKDARVFTPVLGLPAISIVALEAFTALYAHIEQHTTFLMSSGPASVVVTQDAWNSPDRPAQAMPFPPGDYLLYPKEHSVLIQPEFDKLTIENGYVVRSDGDKKIPIMERAAQAAKGVTYVTMRLSASEIKVTPASKKETDQPTGPAPAKPAKKKPN